MAWRSQPFNLPAGIAGRQPIPTRRPRPESDLRHYERIRRPCHPDCHSESRFTHIFGATNPAFTYTINGYVNNDPTTVVSGTPVITTTAVRTSPAGSYPTVASLGTLTAANYNFALVGGTLQVTGGAAQAILFVPLPNFASGGTYQLTARTTSGLPVTYAVSGPAQITGSSLNVTGPGPDHRHRIQRQQR